MVVFVFMFVVVVVRNVCATESTSSLCESQVSAWKPAGTRCSRSFERAEPPDMGHHGVIFAEGLKVAGRSDHQLLLGSDRRAIKEHDNVAAGSFLTRPHVLKLRVQRDHLRQPVQEIIL